MSGRVPVGVAVIITDHADRILLMLRQGKHGAGQWAAPGGWVEPGEGPINAVRRESMEEVGIEIFDPVFLGYTHDIFPEGIEDICLWFHSKVWTGVGQIMEPEKAIKIKWMTLDQFEIIPSDLIFGGIENMDLRKLLGG